MAAVLGLIIGVVLGVFVKPDIPIILQPYLPIMVVAALDALLGAARAYFERSFSDKVFVISFISNVVTATLLVFLGNHQLFLYLLGQEQKFFQLFGVL